MFHGDVLWGRPGIVRIAGHQQDGPRALPRLDADQSSGKDAIVWSIQRGEEVPVQPDPAGPTAVRFAVSNLEPGDYTLEISADGREASRHPITVPAPDYDLEI